MQTHRFKRNIISIVMGLYVFQSMMTIQANAADAAPKILLISQKDVHAEEMQLLDQCLPQGSFVHVFWPELTAGQIQSAQAFILVRPQPADLKALPAPQLKEFVSPTRGLMVLGLPSDPKSFAELARLLPGRLPKSVQRHPATEILHSQWIWRQKPSGGYWARKVFDLPASFERVFLLVTGDDRHATHLNGQQLCAGRNWSKASWIDATAAAQPGKNVFCIHGNNTDGPGGLIGSIYATDKQGRIILCLGTDKTWKASETEPPAQWTGVDFDDSSWGNARVICSYSKGAWSSNVVLDAAPIQTIPSGKAVLGENTTPINVDSWFATPAANANDLALLKQGDVLVALARDDAATGRSVVATIDALPLRAVYGGNSVHLQMDPGGADFLRKSAAWISRIPPSPPHENAGAPPPSPPKAAQNNAEKGGFSFTIQVSEIPGKSWYPPNGLLDLKAFVDEMNLCCVNAIHIGIPILKTEWTRYLAAYARQKGMTLTYFGHGCTEMFSRTDPSPISAFSPKYLETIKKTVAPLAGSFPKDVPLQQIYPFQDEPFHMGTSGFDLSKEARNAFKMKYGYELPVDIDTIMASPKTTLDVLNFHSDSYPVAWRQIYRQIKTIHPEIEIAINHDSHSAFGGTNKDSILMDDVFRWGGDYADAFACDIYPYFNVSKMADYRTGRAREIGKPRISQTHYGLAQMRNLTYTHNKRLGFWVNTLNTRWADGHVITPAAREQWWGTSEMIYTAIANGCDYLIAGIGIPQNARHWEEMKLTMRHVQSIAPSLQKTKKTSAAARFFFPRSELLILQKERWNAGVVFELCQRSFGEIDVLHEDQVADDHLNGCKILVLCDVELIPTTVSKRIASFVRNGGLLVMDRIPSLDEQKQSNPLFADLLKEFGGKRILHFEDKLLETYLRTWAENDIAKRDELHRALRDFQLKNGIIPAVHSSNPDIEAGVRQSADTLLLFLINHESANEKTSVILNHPPFAIRQLTNASTGKTVPFNQTSEGLKLDLSVPFGKALILTAHP
ncbi:MAG: hypothetical protein PHV34_18805 [Verrucomicrobiae bacterium]|nr:hypothetical protein [Verrucomicrobiae bacterium]